MKRLVCILFLLSILASTTRIVYAADDYITEEIPYETIESEIEKELVCPYTLYIMGATTHIIDKDDGKIYMGVEVYCTERMKKISTIFYLQQLISNKWVDVCTVTSTVEDSDYMIKFISVSYPPSGTYRVRTSNYVEDYFGYAEVVEGNSGEIDFVSPYL